MPEISEDDGIRRRPENAKMADKSESLIRAKISLIGDLHSLQGRKKFPVRMRRELARKTLI
jgi:hypothetical protein